MRVLKIALPNNTIADQALDKQVLNSLYPSPKINVLANPPHVGSIFINWTSTIALAEQQTRLIYSFPHGYSYIPTAIAAYKFESANGVVQAMLPFHYVGFGIILIDTDYNNVNIKYYSIDIAIPPDNIPPFTMYIRYYVMAEEGYQ